MPQMARIFTEESCMSNRRIPFNVQLLGPYLGHVWAILGPCFGYFYIIFASIWLKWLEFSQKKSCMPIRKYSLMLTNLDHNGANFGPCLENFYIFNYSYYARNCKILFNGYFGIVWWSIATWGATWDPWSCLGWKNIHVDSCSYPLSLQTLYLDKRD